MKKLDKFLVSLLVIGLIFTGHSQNNNSNNDVPKNFVGVSAQFYPAGFIPTANFEHQFDTKSALIIRLGFNFTDRQDFSDENDTEEGEGFGGSVGYRKYWPWGPGKVLGGLNLDVWGLDIDWTDTDTNGNQISGNTDIVVLQPWLEAGYFLPIRNSASEIGLTLGFGREFNVVTNGDDVAQDFIGTVSVQYKVAF